MEKKVSAILKNVKIYLKLGRLSGATNTWGGELLDGYMFFL